IGADALGAVAISGTVVFTVLSFVIGLNNAALTILSQQKGKGSETGLRNYLNAFVVILAFMSVVSSIAGFFLAQPILAMLGTPDSMIEMATSYLRVNFFGILFLCGYH